MMLTLPLGILGPHRASVLERIGMTVPSVSPI
jgi:hypothetical protein